jgi:hypothetical protein
VRSFRFRCIRICCGTPAVTNLRTTRSHDHTHQRLIDSGAASRSAVNRDDREPDQERNPGNYEAQEKGRNDSDPNGGFARGAFCRRNRMRFLRSFIGVFSCARIRVSLGPTAHSLIHNAMCGSSLLGPTRTSSSAQGISFVGFFRHHSFPCINVAQNLIPATRLSGQRIG